MNSHASPYHQQVLRLADWASLLISLNWIYESTVPPDGQGKRGNPDLSAWLITRGGVRVKTDGGKEVDARPGDWVFLPAGNREQRFSDDAELLSICWKARWPDGRHLFNHGLPLVLPAAANPDLEIAVRKIQDFSRAYLQDDPLPTWRSRVSVRIPADVFLESELLLLAWMRLVIRVLAGRDVHPSLHEIPDSRVLLALEHLEYQPLRNAVKVEQVAAKVGLSTSQLNRLFSQYLGHTPKVHLHLRRVSEAKHLLRSGDLPVKEIAFHLGFASQSAFTHWFTREVGCNPRTFARQTLPAME